MNALDVGRFLVHGALQVGGTVDNGLAKFAVTPHFHEFLIVEGDGEFRRHLLGAMQQCYARLGDAVGAAQVDAIANLRHTLVESGIGNDGRVGHKQQLVVGGHLHGRNMREHAPFGKQTLVAVLFVDDGPQQHVGVQNAFHHHLGLAVARHPDGLAGRCLYGVEVNDLNVGPSLFRGAFYGLERMFVGGFHGHHLARFERLQPLRNFVKIPDLFHGMLRILRKFKKFLPNGQIIYENYSLYPRSKLYWSSGVQEFGSSDDSKKACLSQPFTLERHPLFRLLGA